MKNTGAGYVDEDITIFEVDIAKKKGKAAYR